MTLDGLASRQRDRQYFLKAAGWGDADIKSLVPDASFRSYHRLHQGGAHRMLMDAPPQYENLGAYLDITAHMRALGLRVPRVDASDLASGFALIEDFGDDTFTRLLAAGGNETTLYMLAVDVLKALQSHSDATNIDLPPYDMPTLLREAELFVDWFVPAVRGAVPSEGEKKRYMTAFEAALAGVAHDRRALVLRDYHVDNLMITGEGQGISQCGLLDYQDALLGSPAYDLISLVEDARRDVSAATRNAVLDHYFSGWQAADKEVFERDMALLGAQRHAKVAGIFVRLSRRDNKHIYLGHIPRVLRLLDAHMKRPELTEVRAAVMAMLPDFPTATL